MKRSKQALFSIIFLHFLSAGPALSQINMERFRRDAQKAGLEGSADLDLTVMTGNTNFQLLGINSRLNYSWRSAYTFLVLNGGVGWNQGERFMDNGMAHLRHVHTLGSRLQNEWFIQFDQNKKRKLSEREVFGVGLRGKLLTTRRLKARLGIAYMFEHEQYDLEDNNWHPGRASSHRLSSYTTWEINAGEHLSLLNVTYFQPLLANWRDNRILTENALAIELSTHLALKTTFTLRFDSKPPDGIKKLDTISKYSFSFRF